MWWPLVTLVLWHQVCAANRPVVGGVESKSFSSKELLEIQKAMSLSAGQPLDPYLVDVGVRALYQSGVIQRILVRTKPSGSGVVVLIEGAPLKKVRKIIYEGMDNDVVTEVAGPLELERERVGDLRLVALIEDRCKKAYETRGYYQAQVAVSEVEVAKKVVDLKVTAVPGPATRVEEIHLIGAGPKEVKELLDAIPLKSGSIFNKADVDSSVKTISEYFKSAQYFASRVEKVELNFNDTKERVEVSFFLKVGERYQFVFKGNTAFSDLELREIITAEIVSQTHAPERLAALIREKYKKIGFHFCEVTAERPATAEGKVQLIRFRIQEGHRVVIDDLRFLGGFSLSESKLRKLFFENASGVIRRELYWEAGVEPSLRTLAEKLKEMGFLSVRLTVNRALFREDKRGVDLLIDIDLGVQTLIDAIEVEGVTAFSKDQLIEVLGIEPKEPVHLKEIEKAREKVLTFYHNEGYNDAAFKDTESVRIQPDQERAVLVLSLVEGPRYFVGEIKVDGNQKTREKVILRELTFATGDAFSPEQVRQSEENLLLLNLFSRVEIISSERKDNAHIKDVVVAVYETPPGIGELGAGGVYEEPRFKLKTFGGLGYRNLLGLNHTVSVRGEVLMPVNLDLRFVEYLSSVAYRTPYPFDLPINFITQVGLDRFEVARVSNDLLNQNETTIQRRLRLEGKIEKKISRVLTGIYRLYRFEQSVSTLEVDPKTSGVAHFTQDLDREEIGSTGPGIILDYRDDIFNPKRGSYHSVDVEFAHPLLGSNTDVAFLMALSRNSFYIPLFDPFSLVLYGGVGYAVSLLDGKTLPTVRLRNELALGGSGSIRGYNVREFSAPRETTESTAFYNVRAELSTYIVWDISGLVFFDTGQIFPNLTSSQQRHDGVGFGVSYASPVGPVKLEFAHGLGVSSDKFIKVTFSVGSI